MRLAYVHSANVEVPSANAIQVSRMCEAFTVAGADVTLWYPHYASAQATPRWRAHYGVGETFAAKHVPVWMTERLFHSPALPVLKLAGYTRMLRTLRGVDVIYTRCFAAATMFPRVARAPVIFEAHELPPSPARLRALRGVDAIVSITRAAADAIVEALAFSRDRMLVAPDGVPARWLAQPIDRDEARAALGLARDRALAIYTGRFQPGTAALLAAVATRLRGRVDVLALGMGAAEARAEVGDVAGLAIRDAVGADEIRRYQAAADVLVMPHTGQVRWAAYTSPLKLFEYMAAGRPIVASHLPVLDEVVQHGENAWLVPISDAGALADGIAHVLDDRALAARLVTRARADVARYTWEARARDILALAGRIAA